MDVRTLKPNEADEGTVYFDLREVELVTPRFTPSGGYWHWATWGSPDNEEEIKVAESAEEIFAIPADNDPDKEEILNAKKSEDIDLNVVPKKVEPRKKDVSAEDYADDIFDIIMNTEPLYNRYMKIVEKNGGFGSIVRDVAEDLAVENGEIDSETFRMAKERLNESAQEDKEFMEKEKKVKSNKVKENQSISDKEKKFKEKVSAMNNGIKDLLDVIYDYIENIKHKNEEDMIGKDVEDKVIEKLNKAGDILKDVDLSIVPGKVETEKKDKSGKIKSKIVSMYEKHIEAFIEKNPNDEFEKSKAYNEFKEDVINLLTASVKTGEIKSEQFGELADKLEIKLSEEELNNILAQRPPKPADRPPDGKKWVWDASADDEGEWILMDE